ncbi:alpha/beta fold hydrolase [Insolitispirillum peregrinum]|uniref:2-hydroxy-6-oxonona-2,4-dienedioate hydrolase n=1 Tax=Insolitispirillum peregrinum TaxID=80876 RepID=A0A1N7NBV4_9PROT|nr:alpha/beta hydrolase [Insolitispirillum peregrinum]SIS95847.1 2-hydroxy-6-oxonona-2,4-dienedioate hydrolase [Insolitispirillum peregrinum]
MTTHTPEQAPPHSPQPEFRSLWSAIAGGEVSLRHIDANGVRTRVLEAGSGPTLIFLHGISGHLEAYHRNILSHAKHFRVLAIDMLGHGFTDKPDRDYEIIDYVNHLRDVIDALGVDKIHLSGESLGGWVAARFAALYPDRIDRLVLNTAGGMIADPRVMERLRTLSLNAVRSPDREATRKRLEFLMLDPSIVTEDLVESRFACFRQPGMVTAMERIMCLQDMDVRQRNMLTPDELGRIQAETLVLWTTHDPTASVEVGQRLADLVPASRFVVMDNCGHWPQYEDPDTFNRLHIAFLLGQDA